MLYIFEDLSSVIIVLIINVLLFIGLVWINVDFEDHSKVPNYKEKVITKYDTISKNDSVLVLKIHKYKDNAKE